MDGASMDDDKTNLANVLASAATYNSSKCDSAFEDDFSSFIAFDFPHLHLSTTVEQVDFLLLAWILFAYRSSGASIDAAFTWQYYESKDRISSPTTQLASFLTDFVAVGITELISDILKSIRARRNIAQLSPNGEPDVWAGHHVFLAANDSSEQKGSAEPTTFSIEVRVSRTRLYVREALDHVNRSQGMHKLYIHAFAEILQRVLSDQNQTLASAITIGEYELANIWQWNCNMPPTINRCMHEIISDEMKQNPSRVAVHSWDGQLTYGELDQISTRMALYISTLGVGVGTIVPLCFEKSLWTVVAVLAVMKSGGAFMLMDPQQPEARLRTISTEVGAQIILTSGKQAELGSRILPTAKVVVVGPDLPNLITDSPCTLRPVPPDATLYVIFTSGSTGKPKGVVISHANYTSGALPRAEAVHYKAQSRVLDFASYAFDVSIDCMLCTLSQGGCICVPSDEARVNDLSGAIRNMNVNMAHMTPSVARVLADDVLSSLEVLGLGGESVSSSDAAVWGQHTKVVIAYGPSECTVGCTINNNIAAGRTYTSIGKGVGGVTWIADPDDHDSLAPVGAVGELLIEGPIVGMGYINEPEKTAQVFIEDPAWLKTGTKVIPGRHGRLYKTGDLVKYDQDGSGSIVFVGRKDRQVKLRGQRVELAEIEHHLRKRLPPDASVAAEVITPGGKGNEPRLVAFISEQRQNVSELNGHLATFSTALRTSLTKMDEALGAELPTYMVPTAYIPLYEMPLLVSCKVDRKQLQEIGLAMSNQQLARFRVEGVETHEPKTDIERKMHRLWIQLFGADVEIGVQDNFFAVGGNSLRAMKMVAEARKEGISLTVADIFTHPILSDMASAAAYVSTGSETEIPAFSMLDAGWDAESASAEAAKLCGLNPLLVQDMYPCTPLQEGLMALSAKVKEAYIAQRVVDVADISTAQNLKAAFDAVALDCPILRTRIVQIPGHGLMQIVVNGILPWVSGNSLEDYLLADREKSIELGGSLVRFGGITDGKTGKAHLVLTIHHALYDGWSMPLIIERVNQAYRGLKSNIPKPFKTFIKYLHDADRTASETYWREQLQGAQEQQFPALPFLGYQAQTDSLLERYVEFTAPSASNITIANVVRGAWGLVVAQYTASDDIVFGETLTGRNAPIAGIEDIEGPLITTVPVRIRVNRSTPISEYLQNVHNQTVHRIPHEHVGLQHIRRLSSHAREACELKMGLVLHPNAEETDENPELAQNQPASAFVPAGDVDAAREALNFSSYPLMLVCSMDANGFLVMASFDSKTIDVPQMERVLTEFGRTVQQLCEDTTGRIRDIQFLSDQDRVDLWRLSSSGPRSIAQSGKDVLGESFDGVTATWIVDPVDPEHLLPLGATGELLLENPDETLASSIDSPRWLFEGCLDSPGRHTPLYRTNQLAKYDSNGFIVFVRPKNETEKVKAVIDQSQELEKLSATITTKHRNLMCLWSRVLGIPENEIGFNDSFFDLGGDSIGAMKLVSEARMEGLELTVAQVFRHRRLSEMVDILKDSQSSQRISEVYTPFSALDVPDVRKFLSEAILPCLRQPTWKVSDVLPARPLQEIAVRGTIQLPRYSARYELFYLEAGVDRELLFKSCQDLISGNEILRTVFVNHEGNCFSVVLEELQVPVIEYEINGDLETFSHKLCDLDIQTKMSLGSPFVKFIFVQGDNGQSCLILKISHAQYDEICLPPLLRQLSALYEGRPVSKAIPFSAFVHHVIRVNIPKSKLYWRELLEGSSLTILRPGVALESRKVIAISNVFDISGRSKDITVATLPTAAWALCLARHLGLRDVTFGEVVSGRNIDLPNCDTVMGPCWQYVPARVKFAAGWTALDLLNFVQQQHINSTSFEGIGLTEIVKDCTDWPSDVDWFDSVVHQDVDHVENLAFMSANARMETIYPHLEPLREWKIQAFPKGDTLCIEIVTFESWLDTATSLLGDIGNIMTQLIERPQSLLFE